MPYIVVQDPWGRCWSISSRRKKTLIAWFGEILPIANRALGR
jgi:hypothetical protein